MNEQLMILVAGLSAWLFLRKRLFVTRWFLRLLVLCSPLGFVAVIAGWVTTETGRQPWVVYGLMRTRDAVTPSLAGGDVLVSLAVYVIAYIAIFGAGGYFLVRFLRAGPVEKSVTAERRTTGRSARPLSAASEFD